MTTPIIHYRTTESVRTLTTSNPDVKVALITEIYKTTDTDLKTRKLFNVRGTVKERATEFSVEWEFLCPDDIVAKLDVILSAIRSRTTARNLGFNRQTSNIQVFADLTEWLQVGWKEEQDETFYGYLHFSKDSLSLRAKLENLRSFDALQAMIGY